MRKSPNVRSGLTMMAVSPLMRVHQSDCNLYDEASWRCSQIRIDCSPGCRGRLISLSFTVYMQRLKAAMVLQAIRRSGTA